MSVNSLKSVHRLKCSVKNYDWGKMGSQSHAARLFSLNSEAGIEENKPYAEIWMGTHDSGPSYVLDGVSIGLGYDGLSLKSWIQKNPNVLGDRVVEKWGVNLPFLLKAKNDFCIAFECKGLSLKFWIEKDPSVLGDGVVENWVVNLHFLLKANILLKIAFGYFLWQRPCRYKRILIRKWRDFLHKMRPDVFKDDNHKPEMALALTEFEVLCGFVSLEELKVVFQSVPEITDVIGEVYTKQMLEITEQDDEEKVKDVLRSVFTVLMSASKDVVSKAVSELKNRLSKAAEVRQLTDKEQLVLRLEKQYPSDVGVLAAFFFNYVKLNPGEALYLGANELHAYIYGECIECMATSDNVVRAGLTPKSLDVQVLCSLLTYNQGFPEILQGTLINQYTKRYSPPFDEFEVDHCILPLRESTVFPAGPGPSVFVIMKGEGILRENSSEEDEVKEGNVLFVEANTSVTFTASSELYLYRAGVNSRFFKDS